MSNTCIEIFEPVSGPGVADIGTAPVTSAAVLTVSPTALQFSSSAGGESPAPHFLTVTPSGAGSSNFNVLLDGGSSGSAPPSFLSVAPLSGTSPVTLTVSATPGSLQAGTYSGRILISNPADTSNTGPSTVSVNLKVDASKPQQLTVSPIMLRFNARPGAPGLLVQDLLVSNPGSGSLSFNTSATSGISWISAVTPNSAQAAPDAPVPVQVQVNTSGLAIGSYHDTIHITSAAGNIDVPVSLFISTAGPVLGVSPTGFFFHARQSAGSSAVGSVEILNLGDPGSTVKWTASMVSGSEWLNLFFPSGTVTPATPGVMLLGVAPNATQLPLGPHYALIKIADSDALNSPQFVSAVLNIEPDSVAPSPNLTPGGLFFTTPSGGAAPGAKEVTINTSSATAVAFRVTTATTDQEPWLFATPSSGNATGQSAGTLSVSVDPTGLAAGIYTGRVNVSIGQTLESVNVTFVVQATGGSSAVSKLHPQVSCAASKLAITENGLVNNFAVPAGWPATLIVQLNNDCGSLVTNGSVAASFSNGDAPLALVGDSLGNYSASWQPSAVTPQMVVTLNATSGALQPATAKLFGGIAQNQTPPPTLGQGGTVNNSNPLLDGPLSPGTVAAAYGTGLAPALVNTDILPLPTIFNNTFAMVGSVRAPLYSLSSGQIDIQIPYEVTATQQVPIVVSVNNALSVPITLNIVPAAPGVLSANDGPASPVQNGAHIIAQHLNGSRVDSGSPGKVGEFLVMYLVGLGATDNPVPSGQPALANPLSNVLAKPTVTVDSLPSNVIFAGLTPGFVGLYQIDFQVPTGVHSGDVEVDVVQNGIAANPTKLAVSQ